MIKLLMPFVCTLTVVSAAASDVPMDWALTNSRIVVESPSDETERAAKDLAMHIGKICGAEPVRAMRPSDDVLNFVFTHAPVVNKKNTYMMPQGKYVVRGNSVILSGDPAFAVSLFLEKELGVTWVWPGEDGIVAPKKKNVRLREGATAHFEPSLVKGEFRLFYKMRTYDSRRKFTPEPLQFPNGRNLRWIEENREWARCHMRLADRESFSYGHAFTDWQSRFLNVHPEYLALNEQGGRGVGKGRNAKYVHLCISNESVVDQVISDWVKRGMSKYLNVCENDGHGYCRCVKCKALDADRADECFNDHKTDRYVNFWNRIAEKAIQMRPDVQLVAYAYAAYRHAPRRERIRYSDNIIIGFVPVFTDDFESETMAWKAAGMKKFFLRPNFHCDWGSVPRGFERWIYDNFHKGLDYGMIGVDYDSNLGRTSMRLESYVTARMIADPSGAFDDFCNDFYRAYGSAAPAVKTYYELVRADGERSLELCRNSRSRTLDDSQMNFQTSGRTETGLIRQWEILKKALACTRELAPEERSRLEALAVQAKHAIFVYRFFAAADDPDSLEFAGRALLDFRIKNAKWIQDDFGAQFGGTYGQEGALWMRCGAYLRMMKGETVPYTGTADGWKTDFESGELGTWAKRDAFVAVTDKQASSGRHSVHMKGGEKGGIGLWRLNNRLRAAARYRMSADFLLEPGVKSATMRVCSEPNHSSGQKRVTLGSVHAKPTADGGFTHVELEFETPVGRPIVTFYVSVGPSTVSDASVYFDNAMLERVDKTPTPQAELWHHLSLKAEIAPYRFIFGKPADASDASQFESRYRIDGDTVWFWGDDGGGGTVDYGDNRGKVSLKRKGTLFAVELFAQRELGMKFLWPGDDGIVVDKVEMLVLPATAECSFTSPMPMAKIRNYPCYSNVPWNEVKAFMPRELFDAPTGNDYGSRLVWQLRNRLQDREVLQYGHAFTKWWDRFGKEHPEYFNLHIDQKTGKRTRGYVSPSATKRCVKLCCGNEAVVDQIIADWKASGTGKFLNVCENDWSFWCECDDCRRLDEPKYTPAELFSKDVQLTDRYVNLWNRIAKKARAVREDVMLISYAYATYRLPPKREMLEYPDNMLLGFVYTPEDDWRGAISGWNRAGLKHFFFRPNFFHHMHSIPRGYEKFAFDQFHELRGMGLYGCDYDADDNRMVEAIEFYVMARLFADPTVKFEDVVSDFYSGYGRAAGEVRTYFEDVRRCGEAALRCAINDRVERTEDYDEPERRTIPLGVAYGRREVDFVCQLDALKRAVADHRRKGDLSEVEMKRLIQLRTLAEESLLAYRFMVAAEGEPAAEFVARAEALTAFRMKNRNILPDIYSHVYRKWWGEVRFWKLYNQKKKQMRK